MCEVEKWKEYLEDFLAGADGEFEHSEKNMINSEGNAVIFHKLFSKTETIEWELNRKTEEITGVRHLGR